MAIKTKCWTHIAGVAVQCESIPELAFRLGAELEDVMAARKSAADSGALNAFEFGGRMIVMGVVPTDRKTRSAYSSMTRLADGPLLVGHCTHRLGAYCGGDW